ncbi:MAG: carbonic anhydrase [Verrucomicrobia bacterium]|nr:carbonic anhydrase [Verrucomicrobiota bacterium]
MQKENYSRRHFVRQSLTFTTVALASGLFVASKRTAFADEDTALTPAEGLAELQAGNERYVTGTHTHHDYGPEREELAETQKPFAMIVSCADSRVSPELAFDQSRGRLFVVRVAGNFVDDNGLASLEFGAAVLGSQLIMVLGHTSCGAIKAAIDVVTKGTTLPGHLPGLVDNLKPAIEKAQAESGSGSLLENATRDNVLLNMQKLQTSSPVLAPLVEQNKLKVVGGIYDLTTGKVNLIS